MSAISAAQRKSKYVDEEHLVLLVDGVPLDVMLARTMSDDGAIEGLVPTLLNWLSDENESSLVWSRALPLVGEHSRFPVLMCPDELDLSCTVVIAEVEASTSSITWHRLGLDAAGVDKSAPAQCGEIVNWFKGIGPYVFRRVEYEACLEEFRSQLGGRTV